MPPDIKKVSAIQDIPLGEFSVETKDALGVSPYVDALADFILTCATPMTIAVQGDWGIPTIYYSFM